MIFLSCNPVLWLMTSLDEHLGPVYPPLSPPSQQHLVSGLLGPPDHRVLSGNLGCQESVKLLSPVCDSW